MRDLARVLALAGAVGAVVADFALLDRPLVRNGWITLAFFAVPLGLLLLTSGGKAQGSRKLAVAAWAVLVLALGGYVSMRLFVGRVSGEPAVAVGRTAPDFSLRGGDGRTHSLSDYLGGDRRVLLVFFRAKG